MEIETYKKTKIDDLLDELFDAIYPVGTQIIAKSKPTKGTWSKVSSLEGRFLRVGSTWGATCEEELPNITGDLTQTDARLIGFGSWGDSWTNGALTQKMTNAANVAVGDSFAINEISFNAHNSNNVYVDGGKVQPKGYDIYIWERTA